jgi:hypothetical protein
VVERFFAWVQWQRRIPVRWEYYPQNFLGFIQLRLLGNPLQSILRYVLITPLSYFAQIPDGQGLKQMNKRYALASRSVLTWDLAAASEKAAPAVGMFLSKRPGNPPTYSLAGVILSGMRLN